MMLWLSGAIGTLGVWIMSIAGIAAFSIYKASILVAIFILIIVAFYVVSKSHNTNASYSSLELTIVIFGMSLISLATMWVMQITLTI
jgi:hypothetical protein